MQLSIVIVNWNTGALLAQCLESLHISTFPPEWEVIVVDNASQDDSVSMLKTRFSQVRMMANATNVGYARANNQAAARAQGRYLLLLNPDTIASREALAKLVTFMENHPEAGASSPRLLLPDGSPQPFSFGTDPTLVHLLRRGWNRLVHHHSLHDWAIDRPQIVDWVSGACLLVRREIWEQVRGLDEAFFMYFEDVDLCLRIRHTGWQIVYNPRVEITHLGGQSLRQNPRAPRAYDESLIYFYRKHYGILPAFVLRLLLAIYRFLRSGFRLHTL